MARFALVLLFFASCSSSGDRPLPNVNPTDLGALDVTEIDRDMAADTPLVLDPAIVPFDFRPFASNPPDATEEVRVYQITDEADLLPGPVALGRVGDYMIENGTAKFLIEGNTRNMNPCPWGGNVLDAVYLKGDSPPEDILGEVCLFMNASLTIKPDRFDILPAPDGAGVLAVSGVLTLNDFINLKSMADDLGPGFGNLVNIDTETIPDARITIYYLLRPGDNGLKVISAVRNEGTETLHLSGDHLIASGGDGYYFNPLGLNDGFGASALSSQNLMADPMPFLAFNGERASYAYVPKPFAELQGDRILPVGGAYVIISGVAATLLRSTDVLEALLANRSKFEKLEGVMHIEPGAIDALEHTQYVGDGKLSSMLDRAYEEIGVATVEVTGTVTEGDSPAPNARVTVVDMETNDSLTQTITGEDGTYRMRVPSGRTLRYSARRGNQPSALTQVVAADEDAAIGEITLEPRTTIRVVATRADGSPTPARVTVICDGECQNLPTTRDEDTQFHSLPTGYAAVEYTGIDGIAEIPIPGGVDYRVTVSRGMEWSVWPADAIQTGGQLVSPAVGETTDLTAEIAHVLDTPTSISADFHIHTIGSPDSTVAHETRVKNFMSEGVDIMVTTDHDIVTDFAPAIEALGAQAEITSIIGEEVTTSDLGHFNAFPVELNDEINRRGGALDWGNGDDVALTAEEIFAAIDEQPGEQVIQMNHAAGLGFINLTQADVLRKLTFADREKKRLPTDFITDPVTGDTGLWSDNFTAMELMNGNSQPRFWTLARWWMLMIGRGFAPTGTGVTDTHKLYSDLGGVPRTYTWVEETKSTPSTMEESTYVAAVNAGRAIGTNGPFFEVVMENSTAVTGTFGDTVATGGEPVTARVTIQVPAWIDVTTIDIFVNPTYEDIKADSGEENPDPIPPTDSVALVWDASNETTITGTNRDHVVRSQTVEIPITTDEDAFVVFVVRGAESMFPVVGSSAFAFSNPIFLDADGDGYNNPPYAEEAMTLPIEARRLEAPQSKEEGLHDILHGIQCELH